MRIVEVTGGVDTHADFHVAAVGRGAWFFLGTISRSDVEDADRLHDLLAGYLGAYRTINTEFLAPYFDLTA